MAASLDIPLHGSSVNVVRKCGAALSDVLNTKFGCVATFDGVDFESKSRIAQQQRPTVAPEKRFSVALRGGLQLSVWKADLTCFRADAVVNAANAALKHSGGLAQALSAVGGPQIQQESSDYIKKRGYLNTGDAVVLDAGSLPYLKIIHAVGPDVSINPSKREVAQAKPLLEKVIRNILDRVAEHRLSTVAIPAISSGLFNFPLAQCADTIVAAVKGYYEYSSHNGYFPKEIFLVNNDEPTVKQMERACHQIFSSGAAMLYSQATASNTRGGAKTSAQTTQFRKVLLTLKKDKIEEQHTDVIVNTASGDRKLSIGEISGAILKKAGYGIQSEINQSPKKGNIIITDSYKLNCKKVYHTFCLQKGNAPTQQAEAQQVLFNAVQECLWTAGGSQYKSIAFPAIGTGHLGFSKPEAATIMLNAVVDFAQKFPHTLDVFFVIFPSDRSTFQAFEDQIRSLKQGMSHSSFEPVFEGRSEFHTSKDKAAAAPHISLSGPSHESAKEAEKWLRDLLYNSSGFVDICNNFILHFGTKEFQRLSRLTKPGVSIEEFLTQGHACMKVEGDSKEEIVIAALQVEKMLCDIHKEFVSEEERELRQLSTRNISFKSWEVDRSSSDWLSAFKRQDLRVLKVVKVENSALTFLFDLKKNQLNCSHPPKTMYQRVPAQFCEMINRIGFHAECAPPDDPLFGEGIYFARTIEKAMKLWKEKKEKYLYFVQADVLTGNATQGSPELILPPPVGTDPDVMFDSVNGGADVSVVFSGYQALPKCTITCERV